ncbi:zinc/cadmium/mercury/lead-transporting ATPase [Obesumbacterium proteus]|uniref:zinc/cadmium/mercury/lead-transporting ATPase n=1 Tax=Obesumbacterium proteus TaxID=82983 RepID=UPI001F2856DF|nr:zinc/cadmium/mercury/lead-transporting ATPase [Obesumbacterium proteus]MCE9883913.1 zinc/cadmium/mercury/lead-transporting ATPase [Obesumbacterium proteus]MCE9917661.1 zinc/cadmium/mercury/lead-transporting ATPase [Obesumbacterium proteus]MCE9930086.1 zinc/cadmium/mercury/lead-transporting ATPase [Obesumbacterium proteus]MCG2875594.1 zinc/cadmium/mercury/lead-transporting ATPase [Obesumbacterium proteus]
MSEHIHHSHGTDPTHEHSHNHASSSCGCGHSHSKTQHGCCSDKPASQDSHANSVSSSSSEGDSCCSGGHCHDDADEDEHPSAAPLTPPPIGSQRFSWKIRGMDCPSCAKKIETAVGGIPGVERAAVLFATEKLVVDAGHDVSQKVQAAVEKAGFVLLGAGGTKTQPENGFWKEYGLLISLVVMMIVSYGIEQFSPALGRIAFIATTLVGLAPVVRQAWNLTRSGTPFAIETLMSIAAIGALFIGATEEAAMVLLLFMIGELLESYAASRARKGVTALMALVPEDAVVVENGQRRTVAVSSLMPGQIIEVAPGARMPADAELLADGISFDESALTGESVPVERQSGEKVAAGSLVVDRVCQLRVVSEPGNNAIDRILQLIEEADERRAPIERFLDRFSRYYTPAIMLFSLLVILVPPLLFAQPWDTWIYRGLTMLLIGCPCALVISTPAAITSGLAAATRRGALIKGGAALEQLGRVTTIAFDKTGTLTQGTPQVTDVVALSDTQTDQILTLAAAVEVGSHHPLAQAIVRNVADKKLAMLTADDRQAKAGVGVEGVVNGALVQVMAPTKLPQNALSEDALAQIHALESAGKTVVVVIQAQQPIGVIALSDTLRADAVEALAQLKQMGISGVMLTGDNPRAAAAIASKLGIEYRAGLLPADKVDALTALSQKADTAMVGDGINDAPAMKAASIGIAMGSGSDVALETADAALTHNRLTGLPEIIALSRATHANIRQNITIALGLKAVFMVTSLLGLTGLWLAVLADSGATALVTANALRLLRKSK